MNTTMKNRIAQLENSIELAQTALEAYTASYPTGRARGLLLDQVRAAQVRRDNQVTRALLEDATQRLQNLFPRA